MFTMFPLVAFVVLSGSPAFESRSDVAPAILDFRNQPVMTGGELKFDTLMENGIVLPSDRTGQLFEIADSGSVGPAPVQVSSAPLPAAIYVMPICGVMGWLATRRLRSSLFHGYRAAARRDGFAKRLGKRIATLS